MTAPNAVRDHYTIDGLPARIEAALRQAGFGDGPVLWNELTQLDQFHVRGLPATKDLADALAPGSGESVLDVGSGLGGPARYLAAAHGCRVTGIELTPTFVEIADLLSRRTGLADRTRFVQGDAADLPFPDASFDHAWTEHVAMNVPDKVRLYAGVHRVLKPGGRFAIYDPVRGKNGPVIYPVPWAKDASLSFLSSPQEMADALRAAGFEEMLSVDVTDLGVAWFAERTAPPPPEGVAQLSLPALLGPEVRQWAGNFGQNLREGRVRLMKVVVQKV